MKAIRPAADRGGRRKRAAGEKCIGRQPSVRAETGIRVRAVRDEPYPFRLREKIWLWCVARASRPGHCQDWSERRRPLAELERYAPRIAHHDEQGTVGKLFLDR